MKSTTSTTKKEIYHIVWLRNSPVHDVQMKNKLNKLTLDAKKVGKIEEERFAKSPPNAPWYILGPYYGLCWMLDFIYEGRPIQRFWVLEEVARMPYFAYISMLHLYESFGWWRAGAALRKVHFAEEWNELHHRASQLLELCMIIDSFLLL